MTLGARTDAVLWRAVVDGDVRAFGEVHARHVDRVYRHCFARLGNSSDAEEATNQVFLEAWRKRGRLEVGESGVVPWLLGVAGNVTRNQLRGRRRAVALVHRLHLPRAGHDHGAEVDARLDADRLADALRRALRRLRPMSQDVVALCAIEELDYQEAAAVLGIPVGTVRSRLSRARSALRKALHADGITGSIFEEDGDA